MKKSSGIYGRVAALMAGITVAAVVVTALTGTVGLPRRDKMVVATVYPLYVAVRNVVGDTADIAVENLTGSATGCLHDYQLSPANRMTLQQADLLLLNGAGAESFLDDTLTQLPDLPAVDTSSGAVLLESGGNHAHDEHGHDHAHTDNEHVWTSPTRYAVQVQAVTDALCALDPANAAVYRANGENYRRAVEEIGARLRAAAAKLKSKNCIIFHDSLAYLADDLGLTVAASLHVGEESGVAPADLAAAQQAAGADPSMLVLYDSQYPVRYAGVDRLVTAGHVLAIDTAVVGSGVPQDWLTAMERNVRLLEELV